MSMNANALAAPYEPESDGIIKEAWMPDGRQRPYQICTQCIMDTTDPWITFNEKGVCNHCLYFENNCKPNWFPNEEGSRRLAVKLEEIKRHGDGKEYDCIIGLSGGVDSSYVTVKAVEWGLRPLIVHVDAGWNSELAVKNIEQIINKCGLDLITHVIDWEEMREMQQAFLKSSLANADVPQDHAFFAGLYNYAIKAGIKYVINGSNYATESILPQAWGYDAMDARHVMAVYKAFGERKLKKFPLIGFYQYHYFYPRIWKMNIVAPLNYISYSKTRAIEHLEKEYGWRYYGGKHYESRWTHFFQAYYLPVKFGYDKRKAHLSSLVVAGELTRDQALSEIAKPLYDMNRLREDKLFVSKKLGISINDLEELINSPPRFYTQFPNNQERAKNFAVFISKYDTYLRKIDPYLERVLT